MQNFIHYVPTRILIGNGQLAKLHEQPLPGKKALIVMTAGKSMRKYGYLDRVTEQLRLAGVSYEIFDKVLPNPVLRHVTEGAAAAKKHGCDFVLGLGGGSSIDAAKAIAVMATNPGDYWDYNKGTTGKALPVPYNPLPIVAITTTAGTGTEADPWTVTTKEETKEKCGFGYDKTYPVLSVVDPELMTTVPPDLTAYQGFDALFHATESMINVNENPFGEMCALQAIAYLGKYLPRAVANGSDGEARYYTALGNTLAGFYMMCTSEHSMEHAMSAFHPELPHGAGLIMVSEAYYRHFVDLGVCGDKFIAMARALGNTNAAAPSDFVDALISLQKSCGVYGLKMSGYGIKETELEAFTDNAMTAMAGLFEEDPAPLSRGDVLAIYRASYR